MFQMEMFGIIHGNVWMSIFCFWSVFPNIFLVDPGLAAPGPEMSKLSCVRAMSSQNKTSDRGRNQQIKGVEKRKKKTLAHCKIN